MHLRHRPATASDLKACVPFMTVHSRYGSLLERLPEVWRGLMQRESLISAVVEDGDRPEGDRLLGFGVSVFLTDEFVRHAKTPPLFWVGRELICRIIQNDSPILDLAAIRRANSREGLNCFTWEVGVLAAAEAEFFAAGIELTKAFIELHSGFKVKEVIGQHPQGRIFRAAVQVGGWLLRDPDGQYAPLRDPVAEEPAGPFILGLTRELAHVHPGSWLSSIFNYRPPRLSPTRAEQRLLNAALSGQTDEEVAEVLGVSVSAVKKCWQSVYARASFRLPELLLDGCGPLSGGVRGAEKKRRLLLYLRSHPEELRPLLPSSAPAGTRRKEIHRRDRVSPCIS